jgi:hypothetical protein
MVSAMPEDDVASVRARARAYEAAQAQRGWWATKTACDLYVAAFLVPKLFRSGALARAQTPDRIPTTLDVRAALDGRQDDAQLVAKAVELASRARAFHWPLEFPSIMAVGGFDVILGNPPWDTMSPDAKEFFSTYDPEVRSMAPVDQRARIAELTNDPAIKKAWDGYCRHLYVSANFFKESGRFELFAEGNLGKGDFNIYRMFVELALKLVRQEGRVAQFVPENLYNGANAAAIRRYLFEHCRLHALIGFENSSKVWFDIHSAAKFCLYVASRGDTTNGFPAAFGINTTDKLSLIRNALPFDIPVALVHEFSPVALAVAEIAHESDITIARKLYARFPKFGASVSGLAEREYAAELHMGNNRDDFSPGGQGLPVYEGRMVEAFDHRAKAHVSGRGRAAVWRELPFGSSEKGIHPQWRLAEADVPRKLGDRWRRYRIGFCDVASPTNQRTFVAALIPPRVVCGDKVPTIELTNRSPELLMLLLGVINALCVDFIARKKVALKMAFNVVDSLPLPRAYDGKAVEREIARRALLLAATGPEMVPFWREAAPRVGLDPHDYSPVENIEQRRQLRAELDVLVARDLYGLAKAEMAYLLDPAAILGAGCGFEPFGALKRAEAREFGGKFLTREMILDGWDHLRQSADQQDDRDYQSPNKKAS